ncbi:hypothetical protein PTSG_01072 [Salpingoeca rosetta]|uniref:CP-type G domain-containing protein n=1 Tax=Salpingoeca rosetta (strain ATCC 50818 / BSB-021) TaxID=946362 RepID=F2TYB3_SALR5|nr:uncharacterized protein PTSG_01072 [Salpingoeca rosetta]EGD76372.1 hypothetical protein PTSG_01072 [Salpingoeca rosetta]|eukprot:XP_004998547.1 hypothetical protein PTSG_01072 [Salpingoeca rosetta]
MTMCAAWMRHSFQHVGKTATHWFPGHMAAGLRAMQKNLRRCDCVLEVHDARVPFIGRNPQFKYLAGTPRILLLNKADLAPTPQPEEKEAIMHECLPNGELVYSDVLYISCGKKQADVRQVMPAVLKSIGKDVLDSRQHLRLLIAGMPNVGKSSLVNTLRSVLANKRKCARTGDRPGVTRTVQQDVKIHDDPPVYILDTPGVMIPDLDNQDHAMTLAMLGTLRDELVGEEHVADYLLFSLNQLGIFSYVDRYRLDGPSDNIDVVLAAVAKRIGALLKGGEHDTLRAACAFLDDFRRGRLGPFHLGFNPPHMTHAETFTCASTSVAAASKSHQQQQHQQQQQQLDAGDDGMAAFEAALHTTATSSKPTKKRLQREAIKRHDARRRSRGHA